LDRQQAAHFLPALRGRYGTRRASVETNFAPEFSLATAFWRNSLVSQYRRPDHA